MIRRGSGRMVDIERDYMVDDKRLRLRLKV
jgi:hypothetical protein